MSASFDDLGKLILRLAVGILMLLHGIGKLDPGVGWLVNLLQSKGLPGFVAYGVYIGEVVAPLLLIAGYYTRVGAALIAVNMLFVFGLVHMGDLTSLGKSGGWALELQGLYLFGSVAIALLGAGAYSLGGRHGRLN